MVEKNFWLVRISKKYVFWDTLRGFTPYRLRNQSLAIFFGNEDTRTLFGVLSLRKTRCHLMGVTTHQESWEGGLCKYCKGLPHPSACASL